MTWKEQYTAFHFPDNVDDDDDSDSKSNITITTKNDNHNDDDNSADHDDNHDDPFHRDSSLTTVPHNDQHEGGQSQMIFIIITFFSSHINIQHDSRVCDAILRDWLRNLLWKVALSAPKAQDRKVS